MDFKIFFSVNILKLFQKEGKKTFEGCLTPPLVEAANEQQRRLRGRGLPSGAHALHPRGRVAGPGGGAQRPAGRARGRHEAFGLSRHLHGPGSGRGGPFCPGAHGTRWLKGVFLLKLSRLELGDQNRFGTKGDFEIENE